MLMMETRAGPRHKGTKRPHRAPDHQGAPKKKKKNIYIYYLFYFFCDIAKPSFAISQNKNIYFLQIKIFMYKYKLIYLQTRLGAQYCRFCLGPPKGPALIETG